MEKFSADGLTQQIMDSSSLDNLNTCDYKYYLHRLQNWRRRSRPGDDIHLLWGTAWHDCMDQYDRVLFNGGTRPKAIEAALKCAWVNHGELLRAHPEVQKPNNSKNLNTLLRGIVWYDEHYGDDQMRVAALDSGKPSIEVRFEVPLVGTTRRMSGWLDRIVDFDGQLYVMDRKTTGKELNKWFFEAFYTSNQAYTYIWACRKILGLPIAGFMIDAIQTQVGASKFKRGIIDLTETQVNQWLRGVQRTMARDDANRQAGFWPQNFASCEIYGGCQFKGICSRSPQFHSAFLESDFIKAPPYQPKKGAKI